MHCHICSNIHNDVDIKVFPLNGQNMFSKLLITSLIFTIVSLLLSPLEFAEMTISRTVMKKVLAVETPEVSKTIIVKVRNLMTP
jgi:hypothetical protein